MVSSPKTECCGDQCDQRSWQQINGEEIAIAAGMGIARRFPALIEGDQAMCQSQGSK